MGNLMNNCADLKQGKSLAAITNFTNTFNEMKHILDNLKEGEGIRINRQGDHWIIESEGGGDVEIVNGGGISLGVEKTKKNGKTTIKLSFAYL